MVRLRADAGVTTGNSFTLAYTDLEITTNLAFTGASSGMTLINEHATQSICGGGAVFVDTETNTAGIKYLSGAGALPTITFTRTQPNTAFYATLYTLVVDIFPNDVVELECGFFRYANADLVTCYYPNAGTPPQPDYIHPGIYFLNLFADTRVKFGFNPPTVGSTSATVPLTITSSHTNPLNMHYVDFQFTVESSAPIPPPVAQNVGGYAVDINPASGLNTQYVVIVRRTGGTLNFVPNVAQVLFELLIQRPTPQNAQSNVDLSYTAGRFEGQIVSPPSSFCLTMTKGATGDQTVTFPGDPNCANPNLSIIVTGTPGSSNGNCGDLFVTAGLGGVPSNSQIREVRFVLDLDLSIGAFIDKTNIQNQLPCDLGDNLQACTDRVGTQQCYDVVGNKLTYCFKAASGNEIAYNNETITIPVSAESGCIYGVTVSEVAIYIVGQGMTTCVPSVNVSGFYLCSREISGTVRSGPPSNAECWLEEVDVKIVPTNNACSDHTEVTDCPASPSFAPTPYAHCVCDEGTYTITPERDDNPLNGVTTFDLVLMSKHILALEPLDNPYKMIAADVNKSGSITTFDIVETRKLILGTYSEFPANTPWRFLPKELSLSPTYPFGDFLNDESEFITAVIDNNGVEYSYFRNDGNGNPELTTSTTADFAAIKVGDLNCTAIPCGAAGVCAGCGSFSRPVATSERFLLDVPDVSAKSGEVFLLPVYSASAHPLIAYQSGLRFDPTRCEFLSVSAGDVPGFSPDCLNLNEVADGKIMVLWLSFDHESNFLQPGQVLFYIAFRAVSDLGGNERVLAMDDALFGNLGYTTDHAELHLGFSSLHNNTERGQKAPGMALLVSAMPNPTSGVVELELQSNIVGQARVAVFGPFGARMSYQELLLGKGMNKLPIPEAADWPSGIYTWQVQAAGKKVVGRFVKL